MASVASGTLVSGGDRKPHTHRGAPPPRVTQAWVNVGGGVHGVRPSPYSQRIKAVVAASPWAAFGWLMMKTTA